jgi:uncharacterized membrane protein (Fun14 family)
LTQGIKIFDFFTQILFSLSIGGAGGFLIGYATKKIIKILMVLLGLYALSLFYLMHVEVIKLNSEKLLETMSSLVAQIVGFFSSTLTYLPLSGSFAAGFTLGIVKG